MQVLINPSIGRLLLDRACENNDDARFFLERICQIIALEEDEDKRLCAKNTLIKKAKKFSILRSNLSSVVDQAILKLKESNYLTEENSCKKNLLRQVVSIIVSVLKQSQFSDTLHHRNRSIFKKQNNIETKLYSALRSVQFTCVFGASNKIADIKDTNGLVLTLDHRYNIPGEYHKSVEDSLSLAIASANLKFSHEKQNFFYPSRNWYYHPNSYMDPQVPIVDISCRTPEIDPLTDRRFSLNPSHVELLLAAMLTMVRRKGNCLDRAFLLAKFLWENNLGIRRIEIFPFLGFDHCIVVVNRRGNSTDPKTWGDSWCIDSWFGDRGLIFHASEFNKQIEKIKQFFKIQMEKINEINGSKRETSSYIKNNLLGKCEYEIIPSIHRYPTYSLMPFQPVEYYYEICNVYTSNLKLNRRDLSPILSDLTLHKEKFGLSLGKIRNIR